jgi:hypothetical protein
MVFDTGIDHEFRYSEARDEHVGQSLVKPSTRQGSSPAVANRNEKVPKTLQKYAQGPVIYYFLAAYEKDRL